MQTRPLRQLSLAAHRWWRLRMPVVLAMFAIALSGQASADDYLDPIGGRGGGKFEAHCPANQFLAGFDLQAADDVDAIRPLCVVANGPREVSPPASESNWYGGSGGRFNNVVCTMYKPVVTGMVVSYEGEATEVVNSIHLFCGVAADVQEESHAPSAVFNAPKYSNDSIFGAGAFMGGGSFAQHCPAGQIAVGVHGRTGIWVDAIGLICGDAPRIAVAPPPPPPKPKINATSTTLKSTGHAAAALSSGAATTGLGSSGSSGGAGPTGPSGVPATVPPSVPSPPTPPTVPASTPPPSSKEAVRNAALQSLVETVLSTMQRSPPHATNNARRRGPATLPDSSQPEDSIHVEVRYPTSYGYQDANGASPNSCGAFYLSALPAVDAGASGIIRIDGGERMRSGDGMYVCDYLISAMPRNTPIAVRVAMSDMRAAGSETWLAGTQAQPPAGQRRTILPGDQQVLLTATRPRAALRFEMVYSGAR